ncbi:diguanylate cyclase [Alkalihalophilus sp. As8PL]|uniref:Diguanylate cyclase n=1 Tax=Alkalihalophilus sp. As8PL TaxID=3237103 RepID=A0AB39BXA0_9BACI
MGTSINGDRLFEQAFHFSTIGLVLVGMDGKYLKVNGAYCKMLDCAMEGILSHPFIKHIHQDHQVEVQLSLNTLLNQETMYVNQEVMLHDQKSENTWAELTISLVTNEKNQSLYYLIQVRDLSIQKAISKRLKVSEAKLNQVIETVPSGLMMMNREGEIIFANKLAESILNSRLDAQSRIVYNAPEWKNRHLDGRPMEDHELPFSIVMNTKESVFGVEHMMEGKDGGKTLISVNAAPLYDEIDQIMGVLFSITDITAQKLTEQQLLDANLMFKRQSEIDGLTGIANRRSFDKTLKGEWDKSIKESSALTLIMFDLDSFKNYNDTYGHQQGDDCLRQVATAVQEVVIKDDAFLARYGGEEFAVLKSNATKEESIRLAEKIKETVYKLNIPHENSPVDHVVTVSVGVAVKEDHTYLSIEVFFDWADKAMYQAKRNGRNQVLMYQSNV